jgi:hypothetical protein
MLYLNIYSITLLIIINKKSFEKNITTFEIGNYCEDGAACGIHGNCNINLFELKTIENSSLDLSHYHTHCYCHYGYSTYNVKEKIAAIDPTTNNDLNDIIELNDVRCCYEQKKQMMAFLLEMFTGMGIGHFYLENYFLGFFKLCFNVFMYIVICCGILIICNNEKDEENIINNNINVNGIMINNLNNLNNENNNNNNNNNNKNDNNNDLENKKIYQKLFYIILICFILLFLFYFIDLLLLGIGFHTDGYNQPLRMW